MVFEEMQRRKKGKKKKKSSYLGLLVGSLLGFELHDELPLMNLFIPDLLKYRCEQYLR
jgi:hypothetical protein